MPDICWLIRGSGKQAEWIYPICNLRCNSVDRTIPWRWVKHEKMVWWRYIPMVVKGSNRQWSMSWVRWTGNNKMTYDQPILFNVIKTLKVNHIVFRHALNQCSYWVFDMSFKTKSFVVQNDVTIFVKKRNIEISNTSLMFLFNLCLFCCKIEFENNSCNTLKQWYIFAKKSVCYG